MSEQKLAEEFLQEFIVWSKVWPEIIALYFYGSWVEGRAGAFSDLDAAVMVQAKIPRSRLWRLEDRWLAQWPEYIDLSLLNLAPLPFRYEVTTKGRRVWTADEAAVAKAESLIWRKYWDARPRLEQNWSHYVKHVMEKRNEAERQQYEASLAKVRAVHRRVREASTDYTGKIQA